MKQACSNEEKVNNLRQVLAVIEGLSSFEVNRMNDMTMGYVDAQSRAIPCFVAM
jgi:hypothetical protein